MVLLRTFVVPVEQPSSSDNKNEAFAIKCEPSPQNEDDEISCVMPDVEDLTKITHLDLSNCSFSIFPDSMKLLNHLLVLNMSHNLLSDVPDCLEKNMAKLKHIDLSFNKIKTFNFIPACHANLEELNLNYNELVLFPKWLHRAPNLINVNVGDNSFLQEDYVELKTATSVTHLDISNCNISIENLKMLEKFPNLKHLNLGYKQCTELVEDLPMDVLLEIPKLTHLQVTHGKICSISEINILNNLTYINFEMNNIRRLPNELYALNNLTECKFSRNLIRQLPDDLSKLKNLKRLYLDYNLLTTVPSCLEEMSLELLDLYRNLLKASPIIPSTLKYIDLAKNAIEEPDDALYAEKKTNLRKLLDCESRENGRLSDAELAFDKSELEDSEDDSIPDEEFVDFQRNEANWDSDDEWEPLQNGIYDSTAYHRYYPRNNEEINPGVPGQFDDD